MYINYELSLPLAISRNLEKYCQIKEEKNNEIFDFITPQQTYKKPLTKENLESKILRCMTSKKFHKVDRILEKITLEQLKKLCSIQEPSKLAQDEIKISAIKLHAFDPPTRSRMLRAYDRFKDYIINKKISYILESINGRLNSYYQRIFDIPTSESAFSYQKTAIESAFLFFSSFHNRSLSLFSPFKAYLADLTVLTGFVGLNYIFQHYNTKTKNKLKKQFVDLTEDAKVGLFSPTIGREKQMESLVTNLSSTPLGKGVCVFLLGPPGVGKTQLVEGLATLISQGNTLTLDGKSVIAINTAEIDESYFEEILLTIRDKEDKFILFFDEAHSASNKLLQILKTKL